MTAQLLLDEVCVLLAGLAAEELILGNRSASGGGMPGSDLHLATLCALRFEASYGLGDKLSFLATDTESELLATLKTSHVIRERVEVLISKQMDRVSSLFRGHEAAIKLVADELLTRKRLSAEEFRSLLPQSTFGAAQRRPWVQES